MFQQKPTPSEALDYGRSETPALWERFFGFNVRKVALACLVAAIVIFVYYPFSPGGRQARNMRRAQQLIPQVQRKIPREVRFNQIELGSYTGAGGSLLIHGFVTSQADLTELHALLDPLKLDVPVVWHVVVTPIDLKSTTRF